MHSVNKNEKSSSGIGSPPPPAGGGDGNSVGNMKRREVYRASENAERAKSGAESPLDHYRSIERGETSSEKSPARAFDFLVDTSAKSLDKRKSSSNSLPQRVSSHAKVGELADEEKYLVLPMPFGAYPVQPIYAIFQGPYAKVFEAVGQVLQYDACIQVVKVDKVKGKYRCEIRQAASENKGNGFHLLFWKLPDEKVLLELVVLSSDSTYSWADLFQRLCSNGIMRSSLLQPQNAINADVIPPPIGQLVKPVF